ncbi:BQ2448_7660 [Microbotryum intermedium]|uniref:BQ2448_7660 protein n=1 Tax=Microbotryum intermedium TaxID=269621 RepID=A0A238FR11_9BASI|nr:BQ2448_7660 [Microbotryum intermedium]
MSSIGDKISNAASAVKDSFGENSAAAQKEKDKEVAKGNTGAGIGDRASAAVSALGHKADEEKHSASKEANKEAAKH